MTELYYELDIPSLIKGEKGDKGDKGDQGERGYSIKGDKGDKGDTGAAFTYDMFSPEQLAALKGEDGDDYVITESDYAAIAERVLDMLEIAEEAYY